MDLDKAVLRGEIALHIVCHYALYFSKVTKMRACSRMSNISLLCWKCSLQTFNLLVGLSYSFPPFSFEAVLLLGALFCVLLALAVKAGVWYTEHTVVAKRFGSKDHLQDTFTKKPYKCKWAVKDPRYSLSPPGFIAPKYCLDAYQNSLQ